MRIGSKKIIYILILEWDKTFTKSSSQCIVYKVQCTAIEQSCALKVWRLMHKVQTNYGKYTTRSSENICSSNGSIQKKGKTWWNSIYHKNIWFCEFELMLSRCHLFNIFVR